MKAAALRKIGSGWLAAAVCAIVVLLAGSRLVVLSLEQQAAHTRSAAQRAVDEAASALQSQLQGLVQLAGQRAVSAAAPGDSAATGPAPLAPEPAPSASPAAGRNAFWLADDGRVLGSPTDRDTAREIAAQWASAPSGSGQRLLGPIRLGSRSLVAVRAPLQLPQGNGSSVQIGWSVVYRDLGELLLAARLDRATRQGYDFQLARVDPVSGRKVAFTSSATTPLVDPVGSAIALPTREAWWLAMRPRSGWFPASALVIDVSLLILVTWLVALGVRDCARHLSRLRTALAVSRQRLQRAQGRLSQEIDRRERLQRSFEHAHYHDSFTGLPNRPYFLDQLDRALRGMRSQPDHSAASVAVLLVAVDRYKVITDTLGHTAGDELMVQITRAFDEALSSHERVIARWADDTLAVLLPEVHGPAAMPEAARMLQQALQSAIELRRHRVVVVTSIGATVSDSGLRRTEELMREADIALSTVRSPGGASFAAYGASMQANLVQLVSVEGDLQLALERNEFRLLFQPIVDLQEHHIVGVEALLRWMHPVRGLLTPDQFLSAAEEAGLIVPITHWIILRAGQLYKEWRRRLPPDCVFYISINLSPAALLDPELADYVAEVLSATGTPASALKFELTENGLISNVGAARNALDRLHSMGIELMLDDFGTGYSSLSHLQLFPFDYVKIDGPFDSRLRPELGNAALAGAITQMASTLGLKTIAEIVETNYAVRTLEQIGCGFAQGNVFCAPVEAEQAVQRLIMQVLEPREVRAANDSDDDDDDSPTMILPVVSESTTS
jgi:diguanylate cyclase (GGDEF)-like protein